MSPVLALNAGYLRMANLVQDVDVQACVRWALLHCLDPDFIAATFDLNQTAVRTFSESAFAPTDSAVAAVSLATGHYPDEEICRVLGKDEHWLANVLEQALVEHGLERDFTPSRHTQVVERSSPT